MSRVRIGTTNFMVSEANGASLKAMPATYYIYVENVDRTLDKALANGAKKMFDPMDMPYRDRQAGITDPFGNIWVDQQSAREPGVRFTRSLLQFTLPLSGSGTTSQKYTSSPSGS